MFYVLFCFKSHLQPTTNDARSEVSLGRYSTECTSTRHKTGNYNGISIFIKFLEYESLTLTSDDLSELKLVRRAVTYL